MSNRILFWHVIPTVTGDWYAISSTGAINESVLTRDLSDAMNACWWLNYGNRPRYNPTRTNV